MTTRSTLDVFEDHLRLRAAGDIETDLERNYHENAVLLTGYGIFHGRDGVRMSASILHQQLHGAGYILRTRLIHQNVAFLEWGAETGSLRVADGADSYTIEDGRILVQTIHYTLSSK